MLTINYIRLDCRVVYFFCHIFTFYSKNCETYSTSKIKIDQDFFGTPCIFIYGVWWYGMVNVDLYSAIITKVSNALDTLVSGEKPGFQTLSEGLVVLMCAEVVRQRVPDHGAVHSECSASNSG